MIRIKKFECKDKNNFICVYLIRFRFLEIEIC